MDSAYFYFHTPIGGKEARSGRQRKEKNPARRAPGMETNESATDTPCVIVLQTARMD